MSRDELAEQIRLCQEGHSEAFSWLLEEYGPRLYRYFLRVSGSEADAEDLLQNLFVKLLEKIQGYSHQAKFEHWLFRVAANLTRDRARRQSLRKTLSLHSTDDRQQSLADTLASGEMEPVDHLQQAEKIDALQKALAQLPEVDREIILLRHYGQWTFKEIAEHYEMPVGTALAKVHRGLKRLQRIMTKDEK
jgi:RNA polymerase sigma-70 factor (ECF subfamily)